MTSNVQQTPAFSIDALLQLAKIPENKLPSIKTFLVWANLDETTIDTLTEEALEKLEKKYKAEIEKHFTLGLYAQTILQAASHWSKGKGKLLFAINDNALQVPAPKRVKRSNLDVAIPPCTTAKQFVDVPYLNVADLDKKQSLRRLFVREEWTRLWNDLCNKKNLLLVGPPGTGKSSLVWTWCLYMASQKKPVRWIHIEQDGSIRVVDLTDQIQSFDASIKHLEEIVNQTEAPLLVIDGITKEHSIASANGTVWWRQDPDSRRFILVSSMQFMLKLHELEQKEMEIIYSHGWQTTEYQTACTDDAFYNSIVSNLDAETNPIASKEDKIEAKLYFAGASARWMFHFNTDTTRQHINESLSRVDNFDSLMNGLRGNRSVLFVNQLTTTIDGESILVSQYVTRQLAKITTSSFIIAATSHAKSIRNGAFDGWIFQLDFLFRLEQAYKSNKRISIGKETWEVSDLVEFFKEDDLKKYPDVIAAGDCWLVPTKVNQGCYDALYLSPVKPGKVTLHVVQLTVAKTHSLKLRFVSYVITTLEAMGIKINKMKVVVVVPPEVTPEFKLGTVEDQSTIKNTGWNGKYAVLGFRRAGIND